MKNLLAISQSEEANWLFKADHHYLSARLLYLHNLIFSAEENAGLAIELILKCACKKKNISITNTKHDIPTLWKKAKPPFNLDEGYENYLRKLETILNSRHPDANEWTRGRKGNDDYDSLDFLYLKLRRWIVEMFSNNERIKSEVDLAKANQELFNNAHSRHGAWKLTTILKRSNTSYNLI
ncbi:MAG: hypothetical protein US74_C0034G0006 [Parcubacteria group bacterium GW2011_GWA2_38_13]|nr:MAG: hypothetical protein US74_C0034G0006 [Parcubacteria group bacterium GW2011_GWA2_38_13]